MKTPTSRTELLRFIKKMCQYTNKLGQLQHKVILPHIDFFQLKPNNSLKQIHYLVIHKEVLPTQKKVPTQS